MRAVFDTNVIVAAVLSSRGAPARLLEAWTEGAFELVTSPHLLGELRRVLAYPKIRAHITPADAAGVVSLIETGSVIVEDPQAPPVVTSDDPEDDFVIALAQHTRSILVSGDSDLLVLANRIPVMSPAEFALRLGL